jgi:hypothetical protein
MKMLIVNNTANIIFFIRVIINNYYLEQKYIASPFQNPYLYISPSENSVE